LARPGAAAMLRGMKPITPDQLAEHVARHEASDEQDRDELLRDLLVHAWPTKATQNN
jgi:hypothetical protein